MNRFDKFFEYYKNDEFSYPEFWYGFQIAYSDSDDLYKWTPAIKGLLKSKKDIEYEQIRYYMMNESELAYYEELPERVTVYRGMTLDEYNSGDFGVSWSLKEEIAKYFAFDYPRNYSTNHLKKMVHSIEVSKENILALLNERDEFEVLVIT